MEEEELLRLEGEEREQRLAAISGVARRRSRELEETQRGRERRTPATAVQLDIPAELALILQALSSE